MLLRAIVTTVLLIVGWFVPPYYKSFLLSAAMFSTLALSWDLLGGLVGYVSFGHVVFWGLGAYGTAIMCVRLGWTPFVSIFCAALIAAIIGLLFGVVTLRLSGVYFAIGTLAFAAGVQVVVAYWRNLTGGGGGIYLPPMLSLQICCFLMCLIFTVFYLSLSAMKDRNIGKILKAVRDDEEAAATLGIPVAYVRVAVLTVSAMFAGLAGGIYIVNTCFIDPKTAFDVSITVRMIIMSLLGGLGTVDGAVLGSWIYMVLSEALWARFPQIHKMLLGALLVCIVLFLREGIFNILKKKWQKVRSHAS